MDKIEEPIDYKKPLSRREAAKCLAQAMTLYAALMALLMFLVAAGWCVNKVRRDYEKWQEAKPVSKRVQHEKVVR